MKPNYLCIGTQKGGTYSLMHHINQHPQIYMLSTGETHFFDTHYDKEQMDGYETQFETDKPIVGEKTPSYCYLRYAIDRIHDHYPDIKLIFLLREPAKRAFSQYNMDVPEENLSLEHFMLLMKKDSQKSLKEIDKNGQNIFRRGLYAQQIKYILTKFPRDNLHIAISEDMKSQPQAEYDRLFNFLNVSDFQIQFDQNIHKRKYELSMSPECIRKLHRLYQQHNHELYDLLGSKIDVWQDFYFSYL